MALPVLLLLCLRGAPELWALDPNRPLNEYTRRHYGFAQGLRFPNARAITQTADGYIWVATDPGLAKFDGHRFDIVQAPEARGLHLVLNCLCLARDGALWVGSQGGGLWRFWDGQSRSFSTYDGLLSTTVNCIHEDDRGRLWIGTTSGMNVLEDGKIRALPTNVFPANLNVLTVGEDDAHRFWIGTSKGLYGPDADGPQPIPRAVFGNGEITAICRDGEGGLWLGAESGLIHHAKGGAKVTEVSGLKDNRVLSLYLDRAGMLWVGTKDGLNRVSNGKLVRESPLPGMDRVQVKGFFEDQEGNFWIASNEGVDCLRNPKFVSLTKRHGLRTLEVQSVSEAVDGSIWLGTRQDGLYQWNGRSFVSFGPTQGVRSSLITAVLADHAGRVWAGSRLRGLYRIDSGSVTNLRKSHGLADDNIHALHEDAAGVLWVGTAEGLSRVKEAGVERVQLPLALGNQSVRDIWTAKDGKLWIGTGHGLFALTGTETNHFTTRDGLPSDLVYCVRDDKQGRVWLGTSYGLVCRLPEGWRTWFGPPSTAHRHVFWLAEDDQGHIWYTTPVGIFRVSIRSLLQHWADSRFPVEETVFDHGDGLPDMECLGGRQPAGWRGRDGRLWFPTRGGLAMVDPANLDLNRTPPRVLIEKVSADGREYPANGSFRLPAGTRVVDIQYAGLCFAGPEKVEFKRRLDGFDKDWVPVQNRRAASYTNLRPGRYRFQVVAANDDGVWNETGASVAFDVAAHFYQTGWFLALCVCGILVSVPSFHMYRTRRFRQQKLVLERLVKERTTQLERETAERLALESRLRHSQKLEAVGQLAAGMAHHFNNLLQVIRGNTDFIKIEAPGNLGLNAFINPIVESVEKAGALVSQLLAFSRRHGLWRDALDVSELVRQEAQLLTSLLPPSVSLATRLADSLPPVPADRTLLQQVLTILTTNACEAMPAGGLIEVGTSLEEVTPERARQNPNASPGSYVSLWVRDTGRGMKAEQMDHIFEPFYTTKDVGRGTGLSLPAAFGIVTQHGGWFEVESEVGKGSLFRVLLPVHPLQDQP